MIIQTCYCGKTFMAKQANHRTCSPECAATRKRQYDSQYQKEARKTPEGRAYHRLKQAEYRSRDRGAP